MIYFQFINCFDLQMSWQKMSAWPWPLMSSQPLAKWWVPTEERSHAQSPLLR